MEKYIIAIGIPIIAVIGIYVYENPQYWWVAVVAPMALFRFLMRRTIDPSRKPIYKEESESNHGSIKIEHPSIKVDDK